MSISLKQIEDFFELEEIAIIGVSRDSKKFGYQAYKNFRDKNYNVLPVNPSAEFIDEDKCFKKISELPETVKGIISVAGPDNLLSILQDARDAGIKNVWIQKGGYTSEALEFAKDNFDNLIYNECVFMWTNPVKGIHNFHRGIRKLFGGMPK